MNEVRRQSLTLHIPTRDMVFAFILAKLVAAAAILILAGGPPEQQRLVIAFASTTSMIVFVLLVMLGGRQSLGGVVAGTATADKPAGGLLLWIAVAVLAGLAFRLGASGLVLGVLQTLDPAQIAVEIDDLVSVRSDPALQLDMLAVALMLLGALDEEIVYRRILQTYFCRKFGLAAGICGVALVFGVIHGSAVAMLMGIWLGLLYHCSGRMWVAALAHAVTNLAVFLSAAMQQPGTQMLFFVASYACAALMVAATIFAVLAVRRSVWCTAIR